MAVLCLVDMRTHQLSPGNLKVTPLGWIPSGRVQVTRAAQSAAWSEAGWSADLKVSGPLPVGLCRDRSCLGVAEYTLEPEETTAASCCFCGSTTGPFTQVDAAAGPALPHHDPRRAARSEPAGPLARASRFPRDRQGPTGPDSGPGPVAGWHAAAARSSPWANPATPQRPTRRRPAARATA
jgi:hypothetical protein